MFTFRVQYLIRSNKSLSCNNKQCTIIIEFVNYLNIYIYYRLYYLVRIYKNKNLIIDIYRKRGSRDYYTFYIIEIQNNDIKR